MTGREQAERVITLFIPPEPGDGWTEDAIVWWETDPTSKAKAVLWSGRRREAQECLETWHDMLAAALDAHAAEAVAAEREACARIADEMDWPLTPRKRIDFRWACGELAAAVRARGCIVPLWTALSAPSPASPQPEPSLFERYVLGA